MPAATDEHFMALALRLALRGRGRTRPNPMVGAVLVRDGEVIGTGYHRKYGGPHAEVVAVRNAERDPAGAALYVNLEPCAHHGNTPPCVDMILERRIARVVIGTVDPNPRVHGRSVRALRAHGVPVTCGVLEARCRALNEVFFRYMETGKPFVTLKAALSLDGKIACGTGVSQWISCEASRRKVHRLRSRVDAVLVGSGTVLEDDPRLTVRGVGGAVQPLRVVMDSRLRTPVGARVLTGEAETLIATTDRAPRKKVARLRAHGVSVEIFPADRQGRPALESVLKRLGERGVQHLLVEGGGKLFTCFVEAGAVDRFLLFVAPVLLGGSRAPGFFGGLGADRPDEGISVEMVRTARCGCDLLVEARPVRANRSAEGR